MNDDLGKVSIIVPVYNVEKYFDECINSILHQTYQNLEILIIDDGSKDNSGKKADEYAESDGRIRVFHIENSGPAMARNLGLRHATGAYYCFIDADDYYEPEFVEKMINAADMYDADMVFCNLYACYVDKNEPNCKLQTIEDGKFFSSDEYLYWLYGVSGVFSFIWNKLYKKEILQDLEFEDMLGEDAQIMLTVVDRCKKIVFISDVLYHYRRRKSSIVNMKHEAMILGEMRWIKDHMERLKASQRQSLFNLAQKLYIRKILEEYHYCSKKMRKELLRPFLKKEMKEFMRNPGIDMNLRLKYFVVSLMPYSLGKIVFHPKMDEQYWD